MNYLNQSCVWVFCTSLWVLPSAPQERQKVFLLNGGSVTHQLSPLTTTFFTKVIPFSHEVSCSPHLPFFVPFSVSPVSAPRPLDSPLCSPFVLGPSGELGWSPGDTERSGRRRGRWGNLYAGGVRGGRRKNRGHSRGSRQRAPTRHPFHAWQGRCAEGLPGPRRLPSGPGRGPAKLRLSFSLRLGSLPFSSHPPPQSSIPSSVPTATARA